MEIQKLQEYTAGMSLLFVEDSRSLQALGHELLSKIFDDIDIAGNGEEGLTLYQEKWHDIIITDINMPVMDGIEMLRRIKEIDWDQSVIIFSAYDNSINLKELINLNTSHFLKKPVSYKNMLNVIYPIAKKLYIERRASLLEQEIEEHDAQMRIVMDLIDNGIVTVEPDGKVSEANQKFFEFSGVERVEDIRFEELFVQREGYISGQDIPGLIDYLNHSDDFEDKVVMNGGNGLESFYQVNCRKISAQNRYILSFTDISRYEREMADLKRHIYTDPQTGLPNHEAIIKKIMILKKPKTPLEVVVLSAKNLEQIEKIYGPKVRKEGEGFLLRQIAVSMESAGISKKVFYGSFGTNRYVFITHQKLIPKLTQAIATMDLLYSCPHRNGRDETENIMISIAYKRVPIPHLLQRGHVIKKIDNTFSNILSEA